MKKGHGIGLVAALAAVGVAAFAGQIDTGTAAGQAAPTNDQPPVISGKAAEGEKLTTSNGKWSGTGDITYTYAWLRCDAQGSSCSAISGAKEKTYTLKAVDVGNTLRARVTAKNADGSTPATSVPTAVVTAAPKAPATGCPSGTGVIQADQLGQPARLNIDRQELIPSTVTRSTNGLTARFHVSACGGRPVQGALVYVTAVPYNQFSVPSEQATNADGWAQLSMRRLGGFPAANRQQLLVMFVRARKGSENPLGGISTRRLVSFPVRL